MATQWQIENKERWQAYMKAYRERRKAAGFKAKYTLTDKDKARRKRYYERHKERLNATKKAIYQRNAEKICARQSQPEYREHANKLSRQRRRENPEKYRAIARQLRNQNLEAYREYGHNRRLRERNAAGKCSYAQLVARFEYHGNRCIYCKGTDDLTADHLIPITRGGSNWPSNLAPACRSCNGRKYNRTYGEFMEILRCQ